MSMSTRYQCKRRAPLRTACYLNSCTVSSRRNMRNSPVCSRDYKSTMNNTGELFLRCNNLTLDKYKLITLSRGLTGAVGFAVSLVVLVVILLAARRRAWDTLPKRLFFVTILYTAAYCAAAAAGVHYTRPPSQKSKWCEAMGFLVFYSGALVIVSYLVSLTALVWQVIVPVFPVLGTQLERTCRSRKLWEVILCLGCFFFPVLVTVEPFVPAFHLDPYGNYGPICWFHLKIDENCTYPNSKSLYNTQRYLWTLPFTIMSSLLWILTLIIAVMLCFMYCNFNKTRTGANITKAIRQAVILTVATLVCVAWFIQFFLQSVKQSESFSSWIENVTITPVAVTLIVILVALYIHFPLQLLHNCCKRIMPRRVELQPETRVTDRHTVRSSQWDHKNVPSVTVTHIRHETVTASETSQLINEQSNYQTFVDQST